MSSGYKWHPIKDYDVEPATLTDGELIALRRVWENQKQDLQTRGILDEFERRLRREWSIETGVIEDVYTLSRGITKTLIEHGFNAALIPHGESDKDSGEVAQIIQDHYDALEVVFEFVKGNRPLSTSYIKELHAALLRHTEVHSVEDQFGNKFEKRLEKGKYKLMANNPTRPDGRLHEYSPPEQVASEMDRLVELYSEHQSRDVPVEVEAAWLHHRFTQIHPFPDGNGRVARTLASTVLIKDGWFPLNIRRDDRARYIGALETADNGNLKPLVALVTESQRNAVIQATEIAYDVKPPSTVEEAIAAVRERLVQKGTVPPKEWLRANQNADRLMQFANGEFHKTEVLLRQELTSARPGYEFSMRLRNKISEPLEGEIIKKAGYIAAPSEYFKVLELALDAGRSDNLVLMAFALGPQYRGILAMLPYLAVQGADPVLINGRPFQVNYEEEYASTEMRFGPWLNRVIVEGLSQWRRTL